MFNTVFILLAIFFFCWAAVGNAVWGANAFDLAWAAAFVGVFVHLE